MLTQTAKAEKEKKNREAKLKKDQQKKVIPKKEEVVIPETEEVIGEVIKPVPIIEVKKDQPKKAL